MGKYEQNMYILENESEQIIVWGKTHLDKLMMEIQLNDYIRITFNGVIKTNNEHRMHIYNVQKRVENI